jgi:hypothetical protein
VNVRGTSLATMFVLLVAAQTFAQVAIRVVVLDQTNLPLPASGSRSIAAIK